jgi:hypothetical protein
MHILQLEGAVTQVLVLAAFLLQGFAFVHCLLQPAAAFPAAGKWTKAGWAIVTGLALILVPLFQPLSIFGVAAIIASIVYIVDVRPAVREVSGGRGGSGWRNTGRW